MLIDHPYLNRQLGRTVRTPAIPRTEIAAPRPTEISSETASMGPVASGTYSNNALSYTLTPTIPVVQTAVPPSADDASLIAGAVASRVVAAIAAYFIFK